MLVFFFCIFAPNFRERWSTFDEHIFQRGWFNHQLEMYGGFFEAFHPWTFSIAMGWCHTMILFLTGCYFGWEVLWLCHLSSQDSGCLIWILNCYLVLVFNIGQVYMSGFWRAKNQWFLLLNAIWLGGPLTKLREHDIPFGNIGTAQGVATFFFFFFSNFQFEQIEQLIGKNSIWTVICRYHIPGSRFVHGFHSLPGMWVAPPRCCLITSGPFGIGRGKEKSVSDPKKMDMTIYTMFFGCIFLFSEVAVSFREALINYFSGMGLERWNGPRFEGSFQEVSTLSEGGHLFFWWVWPDGV